MKIFLFTVKKIFLPLLIGLLCSLQMAHAQGKKFKAAEQNIIQQLEKIPTFLKQEQKDSILLTRAQVARFYQIHRKWPEYFWHRSCYYIDAFRLNKAGAVDSAAVLSLPDSVQLLCPKHHDIRIYARNTYFEYFLYTRTKAAPTAYLYQTLQLAEYNLPHDSAAWAETMHLTIQWHSINNKFDSAYYLSQKISPQMYQRFKTRPGHAFVDVVRNLAVIQERRKNYTAAEQHRFTLIHHALSTTDTAEALRQCFHLLNMLQEVAYDFDKSLHVLHFTRTLLTSGTSPESYARYHQMMGRYHYHMADFDLSAISLKQSIKKLDPRTNSELKALISRDLARTYEKLNMIDSALLAFNTFYEYKFSKTLDPERKELNKEFYRTNLLIKAGYVPELKNMRLKLTEKLATTTDNDEKMLLYFNLIQINEATGDTVQHNEWHRQMQQLWAGSRQKTPWIRETAYLNIALQLSKWHISRKAWHYAQPTLEYVDNHFNKLKTAERQFSAAAFIIAYQKNLLLKAEMMHHQAGMEKSSLLAWLDDKNIIDSMLHMQVTQLFTLNDQAGVLSKQAELKAVALQLCHQYYNKLHDADVLQHYLLQISTGYGHILTHQKTEYAQKKKAGIPDSILAIEYKLRNRIGSLAADQNATLFRQQLQALDNFYLKYSNLYYRYQPQASTLYKYKSVPKPRTDELILILYPVSQGIYSASMTTELPIIHFTNDTSWRKKIINFKKSIVKLSAGVDRQGFELYTLLLKPHLATRKDLHHIQKIKILAADELATIPYAALKLESKTKPTKLDYVIEQYALSQHYEFKNIDTAGKAPLQKGTITIFAPFGKSSPDLADYYLPNTQHEIQAIIAATKNTAYSVIVHTQNSYNAFTQLNSATDKATHLHIITHAESSAANPDSAYLLLTHASPGATAKIYSYDLYGLNIQPHHVFLSACESGKGKYINNEGLAGMIRAFFFLDAKVVLASLWKVSDATTATLSQKYYQHYLRSADAELALAKAQRQLIKNSDYNHPYFWSAFMVYKND